MHCGKIVMDMHGAVFRRMCITILPQRAHMSVTNAEFFKWSIMIHVHATARKLQFDIMVYAMRRDPLFNPLVLLLLVRATEPGVIENYGNTVPPGFYRGQGLLWNSTFSTH